MAQIPYRANLNTAMLPPCSKYAGRTVIQAGMDQYNMTQMSLTETPKDKGNPQIYYMHDVMPTIGGIKSIAYQNTLNAVGSAVAGWGTFDMVFGVRDSSNTRGILGITNDGKTAILSSYNPQWKPVTPTGQPVGKECSIANVTGSTFICYPGLGIYTPNVVTGTLSPVTIDWTGVVDAAGAPMTSAKVISICDSNNFLIATDGYTLYWSSALDPTDFVTSLATGASSGVPIAEKGNIVALMPIGIGFGIFTSNNIITALWSGNSQYPWVFKESPNSAGIDYYSQLTNNGDEACVYAWTSAGIMRVSQLKSDVIYPEFTDYITSRSFEYWDETNEVLNEIQLNTDMKVRMAFSNSRYMAISYGPEEYEYIAIYDFELKGWGRLKYKHVHVFDINFAEDAGVITNAAASPKRTLSILTKEGNVITPVFDEYNLDTKAVVMLGSYRLTRSSLTTLQRVIINSAYYSDGVDPNPLAVKALAAIADTGYSETTDDWYRQINGDSVPEVVASLLTEAGLVLLTETDDYFIMGKVNTVKPFDTYTMVFLGYTTGTDVSIQISGPFNINTLELWMVQDGRR